jgi:hypothetical protein
MENNEPKPDNMSRWKGPKELANRTGRPVGTKNKNTQAIRTAYQNLVEMNLTEMSQWLGRIAEKNPATAFELMIKLSEFVIPKISRTEITGSNGEDLFKSLTFEFGTPVNERIIDAEDVDYEETNEEDAI